MSVPRIDIQPVLQGNIEQRKAVAREWGRAFEEVGFATIVGHGVPEPTATGAYNVLSRFFDLPLEEKMRWSVTDRVKTKGYLPVGIESVALTRGDDRPPDLCEALVFAGIDREEPGDLRGKVSLITGNVYPDSPPQLSNAVREYYMAVKSLSVTLMRLSALALDLSEDYFAPFMDRQRGTFRAVAYPDQPDEPKPGQLRYGAHSDYGGLTILRQDDAPGGLQVFTKTGEWLDVMPVAGSFVINVGDLMARWTNDRWVSTLHRVINPPRHLTGSTKRLSLVLFSGPNEDAIISCLPTCADASRPAKYPPVRASVHTQEKLNASMPKKLALEGAT